MKREAYEQDLIEKQLNHKQRINDYQNKEWTPCLHDRCPECHGTGKKLTGHACVHFISCPCPKCTPQY